MEHILHAKLRELRGKSMLKQLRRSQEIPAIVYGSGSESLPVTINAREFHKSFTKISESTIITLKLPDNNDKDVLIKDYEQDTIRGEITHLDFYEIQRGRVLRTMVPIELVGTPEGMKYGGVIENFTHEVEVESLPKNLPEFIELDISKLNVGDSLHISDLPEIKEVKYLSQPEQVIVHVGTSKKAASVTAAETEEEDAEPEESQS